MSVHCTVVDLLGQEEESYIEKAIHQREERFSCQSRERRKRGKDKVSLYRQDTT